MWKANLPRFETAYGIIEPDKEVLEELRSMGYLP